MTDTLYKLFDAVKNDIPSGMLMVEIGSDRSGTGTYYLQNLANQSNNKFVSVDINPVYLGNKVNTVTCSGEDWATNQLPLLNSKICLAVLDNFDWIHNPVAVRNGNAKADDYNLIFDYDLKHLHLNNVNSTIAHTKQLYSMLPYLNDKCVILFGDTYFNHLTDSFTGKGAAAVYILLSEGFEILSASANSKYVLVGRNFNAPNLPNLVISRLSEKYTGPVKKADSILYTGD